MLSRNSVARSTLHTPDGEARKYGDTVASNTRMSSVALPTAHRPARAAESATPQSAAYTKPVSRNGPIWTISPGAGLLWIHGDQLVKTNSASPRPAPIASAAVLAAFRTSGRTMRSRRASMP